MKTKILSLLILICITNYSFSQDLELLLNERYLIELPLVITKFDSFTPIKEIGVSFYNQITEKSAGYIDSKGKYRKATGEYNTEAIVRIHERFVDGKYEKYSKSDSVRIDFIGLINISSQFYCMLVRIEDVPNEFQKSYFYKLLSFNKEGKHLSTVILLEMWDDGSIKDWLTEKSVPTLTCKIKSDSTMLVHWNEGFEDYYTQYISINEDGVFYVEKLIKSQR